MVSKGGGDRRGREDNGNEMGWERKATRGGGEKGKEKYVVGGGCKLKGLCTYQSCILLSKGRSAERSLLFPTPAKRREKKGEYYLSVSA